jgi:hypothetical protein
LLARFRNLVVHLMENTVTGTETSRARERCGSNLCSKFVLPPCLYRTRVPKYLLVGCPYCPLLRRRLNDDPPYTNSKASKARSVGATNLNRASSRSHAVLTVEINILDEERQKSPSAIFLRTLRAPGADFTFPALTGKLVLVDLAGSENNKVWRQLGATCPILMILCR